MLPDDYDPFALEEVSVPYLSGIERTLLFARANFALEEVSVPYLSGQALQLNSTFYPIFVSTFCQDARQLTALPAGNTGFCDSISVTTREPHA